MSILYYSKRSNGVHGFLKLCPQEITPEDTVFKGPEIHFRVKRTLQDAARKAFLGVPFNPQNRPLTLSLVREKVRQTGEFDLIEVARGDQADMQTLWQTLTAQAKAVNCRINFMQGETQNCHTLTFEVLERVGLTPPRQQYLQYVAARKKDAPPEDPILKAEL